MAECNDSKCPVHGSIKVRGNVFSAKVIRAKAAKTIVVERKLLQYVPKYERYRKIRSRISVYIPACMEAKEGDRVRIGETRKLSKTKSFVMLNRIEGDKK